MCEDIGPEDDENSPGKEMKQQKTKEYTTKANEQTQK